MKIKLTLNVMDPDFIDKEHSTGLSNEGDNALITALVDAGFEIVDGPSAVTDGEDDE